MGHRGPRLTGCGDLPGQWRLAHVAYPPLSSDRLELTMGSDGASERPPSRIFQAPTHAPSDSPSRRPLEEVPAEQGRLAGRAGLEPATS